MNYQKWTFIVLCALASEHFLMSIYAFIRYKQDNDRRDQLRNEADESNAKMYALWQQIYGAWDAIASDMKEIHSIVMLKAIDTEPKKKKKP